MCTAFKISGEYSSQTATAFLGCTQKVISLQPDLWNKSISLTYWDNLLNITLPTVLWQSMLKARVTFSKCLSRWESLQKIFHRWYYTPYSFTSIFPDNSAKCWYNCDHSGTLHHIWWSCPVITRLWVVVKTLLMSVTHTPMTLTPNMAFLGVGTQVSFTTHTQIAARLAVARQWKTTQPPHIQDVIHIHNDHLLMEFYYDKSHLTASKCHNQWALLLADNGSVPVS